MSLYLATTHDKYELPVAVADSPRELARIMGTTSGSISSSISHKRPYWYKIEEEEDERTIRTVSEEEKADI
jgi:hypothetical protein